MNPQSHGETNERKYESVLRIANGLILRYGVLISSIMIVSGICEVFLNPGIVSIPGTISQVLSSGIGRPTMNTNELLVGLVRLNGLDILQIGVVILLATPIIRVAVSTVIFAFERDAAYLVIGLFVLLVLLSSVFIVGPFEALSRV